MSESNNQAQSKKTPEKQAQSKMTPENQPQSKKTPENPAQSQKMSFNVASLNTDGQYLINDINAYVKPIIDAYKVGIIFWQEFDNSFDNFSWLCTEDSNYKMKEQLESENKYNIVFYNKNDFTEYIVNDKKFKEGVSKITLDSNKEISDLLIRRFSWLLLNHIKSDKIFLAASIHNFYNDINKGGQMSDAFKKIYLNKIIKYLVDVCVKFNSTFNKNATILIGMDANVTFYDESKISYNIEQQNIYMDIINFVDSKKKIDYIVLIKQKECTLKLNDPNCSGTIKKKIFEYVENEFERCKTQISELSLHLENNASAKPTSNLYEKYEKFYEPSKNFNFYYEKAKQRKNGEYDFFEINNPERRKNSHVLLIKKVSD